MTEWLDPLGRGLIVAGAAFFFTGSLGLVRFPDLYARLHALTKADNLGLGLICLGLALQSGTVAAALKVLLVWGLMLIASSIGATLVASTALACGLRPRQRSRPSSGVDGQEEETSR